MAAAAEASQDLELRHSSIGLADVLFQAITYMAPGVGLAFSIGIAVPISGATLPLSVVVALAACTFCAVAIGQLAKHIPSAGGLYTYAARGIGKGRLPGRLVLCRIRHLPAGLAADPRRLVRRRLPGSGDRLRAGLVVLGARSSPPHLLPDLLRRPHVGQGHGHPGRHRDRRVPALGAYMIASDPNSSAPFTPSDGANGWAGIFQGAVFAILAFIGFEAASALGEEARTRGAPCRWASSARACWSACSTCS